MPKFLRVALCVGACLFSFLSASVRAEHQPLVELGVGLAGISFPDYRGSSEQQNYLLPLPYIVYRGHRFRADRDGLRGLLFEHPRVKLDVSMSGSVPVNSSDNPQREGMDDLDPTFEIGPSLNFNLSDRAERGPRILLPLRSVISVGDQVEHVGWRFHPKFETPIADRPFGFDTKVQIGPQFADSDYHARFYSVTGDDVRADRPVYAAKGGYSGFSVLFSASRKLGDDWWFGGFMRYDDLHGVEFEDSPLVVERDALLVGIGLARIFYRSEAPAAH